MPGEGDQEKGSAGNRSLEDLVENFDPVCLSRPHRPASEVGDNRVIEAEGGRRDLADEAFVEGFSQLYGELGIIREAGDGGALFLCSTTQDPFLPVFQQVGIGLLLLHHGVPVGVSREHLGLGPGPPEPDVDRDLHVVFKEEHTALAAGEVAGNVSPDA